MDAAAPTASKPAEDTLAPADLSAGKPEAAANTPGVPAGEPVAGDHAAPTKSAQVEPDGSEAAKKEKEAALKKEKAKQIEKQRARERARRKRLAARRALLAREAAAAAQQRAYQAAYPFGTPGQGPQFGQMQQPTQLGQTPQTAPRGQPTRTMRAVNPSTAARTQ